MRSKVKAYFSLSAILLAVFALGSVAGAAIDGLYRTNAIAQAGKAPTIRDGEAYLRLLDHRLDLTPKQSSEMRSVLNQTKEQYGSLCAEVKPRYNEVRAEAIEKLRSMLRPDQQQLFDALVSQENCDCPAQPN